MARARKKPDIWDLWEADGIEVRRIQPYQAHKTYTCPGCNQQIPVGMGHLVVVPVLSPDDRGHWHRGCWDRRQTRQNR